MLHFNVCFNFKNRLAFVDDNVCAYVLRVLLLYLINNKIYKNKLFVKTRYYVDVTTTAFLLCRLHLYIENLPNLIYN